MTVVGMCEARLVFIICKIYCSLRLWKQDASATGINKSIYFCTALPDGKEFSIKAYGS